MNCCASVRGLTVFFGAHKALDNVTASFPAGQVSVLLGRSGSGKTTLMRSLNRLNECFEGCREEGEATVTLGGAAHPVRGAGALPLAELRRRVGMVFQNPNPLPVSIRRNITMPLSVVANIPKDEAEASMERALRDVGLWEEVRNRLDRPAAGLSGGQQQRLCLARAIALEPEILLLDEPTASLDRASAARIEELILSFRGRYSIIMVSHSLTQARAVGDCALVLSDGRVENTLDSINNLHPRRI